jgi:hypothetical protein
MTRQQMRCLLLLASGACFAGTALAGEDSTDKSGPGGTGPAWYQVKRPPATFSPVCPSPAPVSQCSSSCLPLARP